MEGDDILMAKFAHDGDLSLQSPELRGAFPQLRDEFQCHDLCRKTSDKYQTKPTAI